MVCGNMDISDDDFEETATNKGPLPDVWNPEFWARSCVSPIFLRGIPSHRFFANRGIGECFHLDLLSIFYDYDPSRRGSIFLRALGTPNSPKRLIDPPREEAK